MYTKTKTIDDELLAQVLFGAIRIDGYYTRQDGSKVLKFTDSNGKQHKYATPRPNNDQIELVKKRWKNIVGLDPEVN